MKNAIITIIVILALLPFMFCTPKSHEVGTVQGDGDAVPLDQIETVDNHTAEITTVGLPSAESEHTNETQAVVLIVSTEKTGEMNAMNTVAILCFNNGREWYGISTGWTMDRHTLYYEATASHDLKTISVKEVMLGEKTNTPVYVREVKGAD